MTKTLYGIAASFFAATPWLDRWLCGIFTPRAPTPKESRRAPFLAMTMEPR